MSVRAEVKSVLFFGDGAAPDASPEGYEPPDREHFGVSAQVFIGEDSGDLADSFDLLVCSPSWMAAQVESGEWDRFRAGGLRSIPDEVAVGSGIWFMRRWDLAAFDGALGAVCASASPAPDWGSLATRIGRLIPWEFDYKYDAHVDGHPGDPFPSSD